MLFIRLILILTLLGGMALVAVAQDESTVTITETAEAAQEEAAPATPEPTIAPPLVPRQVVASGAPPAPTSAPGGMVSLQFPAGQPEDVIDEYQRLTGYTIIRDSALSASGPVTVLTPNEVPIDEAIELISSSLLLNGIVFVDAGPNRVKAISIAGGKNPRSEGVPLHSNIGNLPANEVVTSYFMPLNYISTEEATQIFQGHVQLHAYGSIVPVPGAQALVVTENAILIRQLIQLRELIDVPPSPIDTEFVQLERANATRVAELINQLLESRTETTTTSAAAVTGAPPVNPETGEPMAPPAGGTGASIPVSTGLVAGDAQIIPDPRTNRIIVRTRPINIPYLRKLILEFDRAVELMEPTEYLLNFVSAGEVLPVLVDLLAESEEDRAAATTAAQASQTAGAGGGGQQAQQQRTGGGAQGTSAIGGVGDRLSDPVDVVAAQSVTIGSTTLIADNRVNSILIMGPPENRDKVRTILERLDTRPQQVYLSTVIGQLRLLDGDEFSVDILQRYASSSSGSSGIASSSISRGALPRPDPLSLLTPDVFPSIAGLSAYGVIDNLLDVYVTALSSSNRFEVLSRPTVYTTNNKRATILSGQRIAVPVSTLTDTTNPNAVTSNIRFEDVILKLEVVPLINANREVTLTISQQNNSVVGEQIIGGNSIPTIGTQELNTTVTVPNGSTVVLGGLITTEKNRSISGVPLLSRIPLLGYLFRSTSDSVERSELIVMIQPTVVESNEEMLETSYGEQSRARIGEKFRSHEFALPPESPLIPEALPLPDPQPFTKE